MEKENKEKKSTPDFLRNDRGKTKSNSIEVPSINLPKGGGAIKGIDEKFSVNAVNGTASFSLPLPMSKGRGATPDLGLSYSSGAGNGIFGLGWSLNLQSIKRKTDQELPQYHDTFDSDTFLFSEAEDLVPEFQKEADGSFSRDPDDEYIVREEDSPDGDFRIRYYRPRTEGLFARIERWRHKTTSEIKWRIITKENFTTLLGWTAAARIFDPQNNGRVYKWLPEFSFDDRGNCVKYFYKREDDKGFDASFIHHRNRFSGGDVTYTNLYLKTVFYGNKTPYKSFGDPFNADADFLFQTTLDYGEHAAAAPCAEETDWDFRPDAFSDYKPRFELRTTRLCRRVLVYHFFDELPGGSALVKSLDVAFDTVSQKDITFLKSFRSSGYIKKPDGTYTKKSLPPFEFSYQEHDWDKTVKNAATDDVVNFPGGLADRAYQLTDLFNEGLSGILTEQATGWFYKHNLGNGKFARAKMVTPKPSFAGLGDTLQLSDLDADGQKQLINYSSEPRGYFEIDDDNRWKPFRAFEKLPNINLQDENTRTLDLDGDGIPDVLITEDQVFTWYRSEGKKGFAAARKTSRSYDEEAGPHMLFSDQKQSIFLADMMGDGLTDIVRIRNGEVCYWPNLGYGEFGAKVAMDNAPVFDHPDAFSPGRVEIADIDGSGTADVIYLGKNKFTCWMNLSGNSFTGPAFEIDAFPEISGQTDVKVVDLLGSGVACIVWSSTLAKHAQAPLRYVDLMNSKKPYLMTGYKNNLGKEVSYVYAPSTKFYLEDKLNGRPWITRLHFPVHCVERAETRDTVTGHRFTASYKYHHGYFDHPEREFRGFGMVEQWDSEHFEHWVEGGAGNVVDAELHQAPVLTRSWFHTGAFQRKKVILEQYAGEYWYEERQRAGFPAAHSETPLPDARLIGAPGISAAEIAGLSAQEWREAFRACKSMGLRVETFALDKPAAPTPAQIMAEMTPFTVATHNCVIELLQPKGKNKHAVFTVKESEAITYAYERDPADPRVSHTLNLKLDEYGNVLESASIVYPRKTADAALPLETQAAQNTTYILYTENHFTGDISSAGAHRLRLSSEAKTYELRGVAKAGELYAPADFTGILAASAGVEYHDADRTPPAGSPEKRLVEHARNLFYNADLNAALPLHQLSEKGIAFESYQLAFTLPLVRDIFGLRVNAASLLDGRYVHSEGDDDWWIRSGAIQYLSGGETADDARDRFFVPVSYTDPYGSKTRVSYFSNYFLFVEETEDPLLNKSQVLAFNMRTLAASRIRDINGNISEGISDELGFLKAAAVFGKGTEADELTGLDEFSSAAEDAVIAGFFTAATPAEVTAAGKALLNRATSRFVYDLDACLNSGGKSPVVVSSILREEHFNKNPDSPVQIAFEYSNGLGQVVMKKSQAEPGPAKEVTINADDTYTVADVDTALLNPPRIRWIGNGRAVLNNKGNPVKQYEQYFSTTHKYEDQKELVETGVTPIIYYDAPGRVVRTEFPDATFSRTEFDSWKQRAFDQNDTVMESSWYSDRFNRLIDAKLAAEGKDPAREKLSAIKAARHADTPAELHIDTLGRPVLQIEHNKDLVGGDLFYRTTTELDIEGNLRSVTDDRGNVVMAYKYNMLGAPCYQQGMDAGQRWMLQNILGQPLRNWDERDQQVQFFYDDPLHRPTQTKIIGGDGPVPLDNVFDRSIYGESLLLPGRTNEAALQARNILGNPIMHYDTGGLVQTGEYDFKGQPVATVRKLFRRYKEVCNWIDANLAVDLETQDFIFQTRTDALGRVTSRTAPDGSVITPSYNEAGLLNSQSVLHSGAAVAVPYIKNIDYNEKGQRRRITYGNDVFTNFYYDKETFRLNRLESKRAGADPLQDWHYTYDPAGNINFAEDTNVPVVFFDNVKITGLCEYTYDALYRLVQATGREHDAALMHGPRDNWDDAPYIRPTNPGDAMAMRIYTQDYEYDSVGNIGLMRHQAPGNNWTRTYTYEANNNRLVNTKVGPQTYSYVHHPRHGFITEMPNLEDIGWNFKEEVAKTVRQRRLDGGVPETTYYQYDGSGQRIRKITENTADPDVPAPTRKEERIYIGSYEIFKQHSGPRAGLERESLSLMDEGHRFVMVETRNDVDDGTEKQLTRYQLHNYLGSAALELGTDAAVISYEEYHPYGTTAYQAKNTAIRSAAKRYRFTGMERDEESGLEYHSARYYLPWLGRWLNSDPIGIKDGLNLYRYVSCNPIRKVDSSGTEELTIYHRTTEKAAKSMAASGAKTNVNRPHVWAGGGFYGADTPSIPGSGARGETIVAQKVKADKVVDLDQLKGGGKNLASAMQDNAEGKKIRRDIYRQMNDERKTAYQTKGRKPSDAEVDKFFKDYMDKQLQKVAPNADVIKWKNPDGTTTFVVKKPSALVGSPTAVGKMVGGTFVPGTPKVVPKAPVKSPVKAPHVSTPHAPRTPRSPKGGIILGLIIAGGVFAYTGDAYAAAQSANPAAETTDALVSGGGAAEVVGGAALDVATLYPPVAIVRAGAALNQMAMDASHFPVPEGFVAARIAEGRDPFCALCHGEGNLREKKPTFPTPSFPTSPFTGADNKALVDFIRAQ